MIFQLIAFKLPMQPHPAFPQEYYAGLDENGLPIRTTDPRQAKKYQTVANAQYVMSDLVGERVQSIFTFEIEPHDFEDSA